jgi:16S rRNA (uracil1498-N3)-methyltransferase
MPKALGYNFDKGVTLRRFFVEEIEHTKGYCVMSGSEARHILRVLRMGKGDSFVLMDGKGNRFEAEIVDSSRKRELVVRLKRPLPVPPPSSIQISLCQALLKSTAMDLIIEKASELGVKEIIPFSSERTVVRLDGDKAANKTRRWRQIAQSAAKQSGRRKASEIALPFSFCELMRKWRSVDGMKLALWEKEESSDLKNILRPYPSSVNRFIGMVGPEGGFSEEELNMAKEAGFRPVSMGRSIFRSETAAIILVALVQYEWGDLGIPGLT